MLILKLIVIIALSYVLGKISDRLIKTLDKFSKTIRIGAYEMTAVIIALATSLPEIIVSVSSSLQKLPSLALGNAIGSNLVNVSLVMGLTAIAGGGLHFNNEQKLRATLSQLAYIFIPFLLIIDRSISRLDGIILITIYGWYVYGLVKKDQSAKSAETYKSNISKNQIIWLVVRMLGYLAVMIISAEIIVKLAQSAAISIGLPVWFIGLFLVSAGTSLPELIFNIEAAKKRKVSMSLGNVIGSCVANATLAVGLSAVIYPIGSSATNGILATGIEQFFTVILLVFFVHSKHKLEVWEGIVLMGLFFYYTVIELIIR